MDILFYILIAFSSLLAGMGIGGGSIFLLVSPFVTKIDYGTLQAYNLIMFIVSGISASIVNLKNKNIDLNILKKIIFLLIIGSLIGAFITKNIDKIFLQKIFLVFMGLLGIYEIISSLKNIISNKIKLDERS